MNIDNLGISAYVRRLGLGGGALVEPSIVVRDLDLKETLVDMNSSTPFYPACMIKLPLVAALLSEAAEGTLGDQGHVTIRAENMTETPPPAPFHAGDTVPIGRLITHCIRYSDNVAANTLIDIVGRARATELAQSWGLSNTNIRLKLTGNKPLVEDPEVLGRNSHPPIDAARMLELIANSEIPLAGDLRKAMLINEDAVLKSCGFSKGNVVSYKAGFTESVTHAGYICQTRNRHLIIVIYTNCSYSDATNATLAMLVREILSRFDAN